MNIKPFFKFIEEVHSCPAVWDVSFVVYKDIKKEKKKKQTKSGAARGQSGFRPSISISQPLSVYSFSSSVSLLYVSATALS